MTVGYYRRQVLQPRRHRQPEPRASPTGRRSASRRRPIRACRCRAQPITMYSAERQQGRRGHRQPAHVLGRQHAPSTTASSSAPTCAATSCCCSAASPPNGAPRPSATARLRDDTRGQSEQRCGSATRCRRSAPLQDVGRVPAAVGVPVERHVHGDSRSRASTPTTRVTAAIAGRPIIGSTAGATTITVNLVEPNTVFLDYKKQLDLRLGAQLPLRYAAASRASPTSSTCSTPARCCASTRPTAPTPRPTRG